MVSDIQTDWDSTSKAKDRFERKIRQFVRTHIKPTPHIQVTFEDVRGLVIAKITVARGEAPAYMMRGVIYVRDGSSDVQAQLEDLRRLVSQYAFLIRKNLQPQVTGLAVSSHRPFGQKTVIV